MLYPCGATTHPVQILLVVERDVGASSTLFDHIQSWTRHSGPRSTSPTSVLGKGSGASYVVPISIVVSGRMSSDRPAASTCAYVALVNGEQEAHHANCTDCRDEMELATVAEMTSRLSRGPLHLGQGASPRPPTTAPDPPDSGIRQVGWPVLKGARMRYSERTVSGNATCRTGGASTEGSRSDTCTATSRAVLHSG